MDSKTELQDIYKDGIDFAALASADDDFAQVYRCGKLDLQDPRSLQQLTKSLLKRDFNIKLELPEDRLCPPVPIRLAYITFLTSLLSSTHPSYSPSSTSPVTGLDIGTGASLIYPLLGTSTHPTWTFHATDIDAHSLSFAHLNHSHNPSLSPRITIHSTTPAAPLLDLNTWDIPSLDFCMCNPPFYASPADLYASAENKILPPSAVCTGGENEMVTAGGDAGFALRMVEESIGLRERVRWYSIMLGRLSSVHTVVEAVKKAGCGNWAVGVLGPGRRTRRWVMAWSWGQYRPSEELVRAGDVGQGLWGPATLRTVGVDGEGEEWVRERVGRVLGELDVRWTWDGGKDCGVVEAWGNTWSRSARRKRARVDGDGDVKATNGAEESDEKVALAVRITVHKESLEVRWLRGLDAVLFESFCGMLKRAMKPA
ncbi:hypothetical protein K461DRAFT_293063 [Myriangium duriaei CBS 260.36]|uniref:U6 small nuclear RNA (adenine-(43)-N(6))-methyltransferase n=1 Tax=Myriangium duriaei CBS 260.36 TaxID=1168546 RepID=A0A9P4J5D3_9PEZI|nr:hypothetical protein K461DRAFT_293063 [Myriangium duriaei CBS 260.36]